MQTLTDFELIIVDDASTDHTVQVVRGFNDPRIRVLQNEVNLGLLANWSKALSCVKGRFVKLLCGDDILRPDCLKQQFEALASSSNSKAVLSLCNRSVIDALGRVVLRRKMPFPGGRSKGRALIKASIRSGTNLLGEPAVGLFRAEFLEKVRLDQAPNPYVADIWLWAELLRCGEAFIDPSWMASFRISPLAASTRIGSKQAANFCEFVRLMRKDGYYGISASDSVRAFVGSFTKGVLRNLFLRMHFWQLKADGRVGKGSARLLGSFAN